MTIELIDMDTGATMEVHGDKTSGLQYIGVPTERALRYDELYNRVFEYFNNDGVLHENDINDILYALELMAKEKTNG
jgi:hypothetical protein